MCRSCHAPEADPSADAPAELSQLGVGCVTCHLSGEVVLAAPRAEAGPERAPHRLQRDARFASVGACASCHEFAFPDTLARPRPELMQSTVSEHARGKFAGLACATCHMPKDGTRRQHGFSRQRRESSLKDAIVVRARRISSRRVELELESVGVGHAFPTGDLFRRLEISVEAVGDDYASVTRSVRYLARHYRPLGKVGVPRRVIHDDRLGADGTRRALVELTLAPAADGFPLAWRVAYQRVEHPAGVSDESAVIESEVTLAQGELPVNLEKP